MVRGADRIALLLLWFAINIAIGKQTQDAEGHRTEVPDGDDGFGQMPFCDLQLMTPQQIQHLKAHIIRLLKKNHQRHYHKLLRLKRATVGDQAKIWNKLPATKGKERFYLVPYTVLSHYDEHDFKPVFEAMEAIQKETCIRFAHIDTFAKKKLFDGEDYLAIVNEPGCHSVIGRHGGKNTLQLELGPKVNLKNGSWTRKTCMKRRIIIHELFHLLGLFHEHQRSDREKFLQVILPNVKKDKINNFEVQKDDNTWGFPYNFDSIMNYRQNAFAIDPKKLTIRIRSGNQICQLGMGMHEHASELDFLLVNMLYNCPNVEKKMESFVDRFLAKQNVNRRRTKTKLEKAKVLEKKVHQYVQQWKKEEMEEQHHHHPHPNAIVAARLMQQKMPQRNANNNNKNIGKIVPPPSKQPIRQNVPKKPAAIPAKTTMKRPMAKKVPINKNRGKGGGRR